MPEWLRATWGPQATIINQAELAAVPILAATMPEVLYCQDVVWFVDNTSAESALIKAGSPTETMCRPALRAAAMMAGQPPCVNKHVLYVLFYVAGAVSEHQIGTLISKCGFFVHLLFQNAKLTL